MVSQGTAVGLEDLRFEALDYAMPEIASTVGDETIPLGDVAPTEASPSGIEASLLEEFVKESEVAALPQAAAPVVEHSLIPSVLEGEPVTLADLELRYIREVLERCEGVKDRAAKILGIDRKTLYRKLQAADAAENSAAQ